MPGRQPHMTHQGAGGPRWTDEQRLRIAGQLMAPLMRRDMETHELDLAAEVAWAGVRALERTSRRAPR